MITQHSKLSWPLMLAGAATVLLVCGTVYYYLSQAREANDRLIASQIKQLQDIFGQINESCKITGFRDEKNRIDFLNVGSFSGSIVGSMNLLEPKNWAGPYVDESLTAQGKEYQIVVLKNGESYIIPGDGVKLANGQIIGKTLQISADSSLEEMMRDPKALFSEGNSLAAKIDTYRTLSDKASKKDQPRTEDIT